MTQPTPSERPAPTEVRDVDERATGAGERDPNLARVFLRLRVTARA